MKIFALLALTIFFTSAHAGDVYRCTSADGKVTFSQIECGAGAEVVSVEPIPASEPSSQSDGDPLGRHNAAVEALDEIAKRQKKKRLETKIQDLVGSRNALEGKRDKKIERLQKKLRDAYDFREKAVIESEIREAKHDYWADRRRISDKIHDYEMQLLRCCR